MERERRYHGSRSKFGMCVNEECKKYKEIQEIPYGDFKCPECGKPLTECPQPGKKKGNTKLAAIIASLAILAAIIGAIVWMSGSSDKAGPQPGGGVAVVDSDSIRKAQIEQDRIDSLRNDSILKAKEAEGKQKDGNSEVKASPTAPKPQSAGTSGTKDLGYAVYKGTLKNGLPDGVNGRLTFKTQHVIDSKDPKGRTAEPGDYVIGEFVAGHLVQGRWYSADNTLKGGIMIGM